MIESALTEAAKSELRYEHLKQPDWFQESLETLEPLLCQKNQLYAKWLSTGQTNDRRRFSEARAAARKAVRAAKNYWYQHKAKEAQQGRFGGKLVWACIRDMQRCRRGLRPIRSTTVKDENGSPCVTTTSRHQRWRRHFTSVLNIQSHFTLAVLEKSDQRPLRPSLAELPSMAEVMEAVKKLQCRKAAGSNGISPEMVKTACKDEVFRGYLLDLIQSTWRERRVPQQWSDAIFVPVPKKGDLSQCDNWRGISLLDVVGKVAARVVHGRLQDLAESVLPESQCGFRKGRGCTDMIYAVRQLVEKSWEHQAKVWLVFIDLKKAYDSVPREALWMALEKLGVPEQLTDLIRSFHQGMKAKIRLEDEVLEEIEVNSGLRQGCCIAPALFNLPAHGPVGGKDERCERSWGLLKAQG